MTETELLEEKATALEIIAPPTPPAPANPAPAAVPSPEEEAAPA